MEVHRWAPTPSSCRLCRLKKRRCDRGHPCSNCAQRRFTCDYPGTDNPGEQAVVAEISNSVSPSHNSFVANQSSLEARPPLSDLPLSEEILRRLARLEEALLEKRSGSAQVIQDHGSSRAFPAFMPYGLHPQPVPHSKPRLDVDYIVRHLPPIEQARHLLDHYTTGFHLVISILHMDTTRSLMESTYAGILNGEKPDLANVLLLFSMFAGAALFWNSRLLEKLNTTAAESKAAFMAYSKHAMTIVEDPSSLTPSTVALAAMVILSQVTANSDGIPLNIHLIRVRCKLMSRALQIHCLDSATSREQRRLNKTSEIDTEVRRRIWWNLVASDWIACVSGGTMEGAYTYHPKHMNVRYPSNVDDEFVTPSGILKNPPLSEPSFMTGFIHRIKMADLCREAVDLVPSMLLESSPVDYSDVMKLDEMFRGFLRDLPYFYQLDAASIERSKELYAKRPYIPLQRITVHFSLQSRICRLHRPFHFEGMTNPERSYSRKMCLRSAYAVLDLRRQMDDAALQMNVNPARLWTPMQHVFLAAIILATDVSLDPSAPDAEERKAKALFAYRVIEKSGEESSALMEGIQRNMQAILSTLQKQRPQGTGPAKASHMSASKRKGDWEDAAAPSDSFSAIRSNSGVPDGQLDGSGANVATTDREVLSDEAQGIEESRDNGDLPENWDQLWSEFLAIAPELEIPQWNSLLDDIDFS